MSISNGISMTTLNPLSSPTIPPPSLNEEDLKGFLKEYGWPKGLQETMIKELTLVSRRYYLLDDSGSMVEPDGRRLLKLKNDFKLVQASRWTELTDAVQFHLGVVKSSGTTAEFRFLNSSDPIEVSPSNPERHLLVRSILDGAPGGGTPLCRNVAGIVESIKSCEDALKAKGQKACIIIFTDGVASDGDLSLAMRPLNDLPCYVIIRLCTKDEAIIKYWEDIDKNLEVQLDIMKDFVSEAKDVNAFNNWLTYGEPLHKMREFGCRLREFDLMNEKQLINAQMKAVVQAIIGGTPDSYPNPDADAKGFLSTVDYQLQSVEKVYDPVSEKMDVWFKKNKMKALLPKQGCCCTIQ